MFKTLLSFSQASDHYLDCSLQNIYCKEKYFLNNLWYNEIHSDPNTQIRVLLFPFSERDMLKELDEDL